MYSSQLTRLYSNLGLSPQRKMWFAPYCLIIIRAAFIIIQNDPTNAAPSAVTIWSGKH